MTTNYFEITNIINSIRFYLMLSIVCLNTPHFVGDAEEQLKSFLYSLENESSYSKDKIRQYVKTASDTIPSAFTKHYGYDSVLRR